VELRRTLVEPFVDLPMVSLEELQEARECGTLSGLLLPVDTGLTGWSRVDIDSDQQAKFKHGQGFLLPGFDSECGKVRVYGPEENLLGLAELSADGNLQPSRVFNM
jgi:tRNA U55 pseudouridine synthase TruB